MAAIHYRRPGAVSRWIMNPAVLLANRLGLSIWGSRILQVRGRATGAVREVPVNLLTHEGVDYVVAPRGVTQWVRNLRAAGRGCLRLGRRAEPFAAVELGDADKEAILRAYLRRWKAEVGVFFDGVDADSPDDEIARIAPLHPVFRIERVQDAA